MKSHASRLLCVALLVLLPAIAVAERQFISEIIEPADAPLSINVAAGSHVIVKNFVQDGGERPTRGMIAVYDMKGKAAFVMPAAIIGHSRGGTNREFYIAGPAVIHLSPVADAKMFLTYELVTK